MLLFSLRKGSREPWNREVVEQPYFWRDNDALIRVKANAKFECGVSAIALTGWRTEIEVAGNCARPPPEFSALAHAGS